MPKRKIDGRPFAVFDIDGTLFRSSLVIKFVETAIDLGVFPPDTPKIYEQSYRNWKDRSSEDAYLHYVDDVVKAFIKHIAGKHKEEVAKVAKETMRWHKQTYVYTKQLIQQLRSTHAIIAISGSNIEVLSQFAPAYGFDIYIGTELEIVNDYFTGEEVKLGHHNKDATLKDLISKHNLKYKGSIAVGDTDHDISMLKMAENPIAFNPNKQLYSFAKKQGWPIVVERKNVIYKLENKNGKYILV